MSDYGEPIKNFEKTRAYIRNSYAYGFARTSEDGNVYSRVIDHNPLYVAWKLRDFTANDITLHFVLLDILHSPKLSLSLPEIMRRIDGGYFSKFNHPIIFDESTIRKKLKEYEAEGIIVSEKLGRKVMYRRCRDTVISNGACDALDFFSETAPCGVIGSFLLDRHRRGVCAFGFRDHYITPALDSDVLATLFDAIRQKSAVFLKSITRRADTPTEFELVPLRIFISVQNGDQHLLAYQPDTGNHRAIRLDSISSVRLSEVYAGFDIARDRLDSMQSHMWGVSRTAEAQRREHVEFTIYVGEDEWHEAERLEREKRCGSVERLDEHHYRFSADVTDADELISWIRTFICRITAIEFSNRTLENRFHGELRKMYDMYGI